MRRAPLRGDDRGATLPEMLITMMIFGIVVSATITLVIGFQRSNAQNVSRQEQISTANVAMQEMVRTLRSAVKPAQLPACAAASCPEEAFITASDFRVRFYSNLENAGNAVGPSRVEYWVATGGADEGTLYQTVQRPDSNLPGPSGSYEYCNATAVGASAACRSRYQVKPIATGVRTDGTPLFSYFNQSGAAMVPPSGGSLPTNQMAHMLGVEMRVRVQSDAAYTADPTELVQRITLPNAAALIRQLQEEATP
ncbi:MAG TPA: type II secretion system protein [Actinotalea sp.]|nr:type II secretion system protein [Actinotalea sp.]